MGNGFILKEDKYPNLREMISYGDGFYTIKQIEIKEKYKEFEKAVKDKKTLDEFNREFVDSRLFKKALGKSNIEIDHNDLEMQSLFYIL